MPRIIFNAIYIDESQLSGFITLWDRFEALDVTHTTRRSFYTLTHAPSNNDLRN
jgi:hypothetical protein